MRFPLLLAVVPRFFGKIIYIFKNVCLFVYTAFAVSEKVGLEHTGLTTQVGLL